MMTTDQRIYLYDTTLRDGAQTSGVDFSLADKQAIASDLDAFGIDYLECGWPGANPLDDAFFAALPRLENTRAVAFGMTARAGIAPMEDAQLRAVLAAPVDVICLVGKTWDFHVDVALNIPLEQNLSLIADSVAFAVSQGKEVLFDAEHFFDGYKANPSYALACARAAWKAGARWVVLCDTNGGLLPDEVRTIVQAITVHIPGGHLGIHCHNDAEVAVANSLAAVAAGVCQVQGTFGGLGERCGNANLASIIPALILKQGWRTGVDPQQLTRLTPLVRRLETRLNRPHNRHAAYVGESAFAHKGGLHISAVVRNPRSYEHLDPATVGNTRKILVSDQSGKSALTDRLAALNVPLPEDKTRLNTLLTRIKELEFSGFAFENADASFVLLAQDVLHGLKRFFELGGFRVVDEKTVSADGSIQTSSVATVLVNINGDKHTAEASGNGPVNALDTALRRVLLKAYPVLATVKLVDYKVRILTPQDGTEAITRVLIESQDALGRIWATVGVSTNVIDASCKAVEEALRYKLFVEKDA
jgi:2-isopropylmalate synthase